jgi:hypothetical protein
MNFLDGIVVMTHVFPSIKPHYCVVDKKAAAVPHIAMAVETTKIVTSAVVAFLSKDIFAAIGPITHRTKTEKDPRMAMIEPKLGTRIDTITARQTKVIRSQATSRRLRERLRLRAKITDDFGSASKASTGALQSMPNKASNAIFSGLVLRANLVLCPKTLS